MADKEFILPIQGNKTAAEIAAINDQIARGLVTYSNSQEITLSAPGLATNGTMYRLVGEDIAAQFKPVPVDGGGNTQSTGGIAGLGDSITANGVSGLANLATGVIGTVGVRNWIMWASLLSGGRVPYAGVAATGGFTTQQIIDTHLQTMVDAVRSGRVATVTVLCGTNDVGAGIPLATITANLTLIYATLMNAGARVVACTLTPRESAPGVQDLTSRRAALSRLNAWISTRKGVLVCDMHTPCVQPSGVWVTGYNGDNVHPNGSGAKAMGQALAATLLSAQPVINAPFLAATSESTSGAGYSQSGNPLMTDTDADGKPDGVVTANATVTTNTTGYGLRGNYAKINPAAMGTAFANFGNGVTAVAGDLIFISARIRSTVEAASGSADFGLVSKPSDATVIAFLGAWDRDVPDGSVLSLIAVVPAMGAETLLGLQMKARAATEASAEIAQVTVYNMTTAGLVA